MIPLSKRRAAFWRTRDQGLREYRWIGASSYQLLTQFWIFRSKSLCLNQWYLWNHLCFQIFRCTNWLKREWIHRGFPQGMVSIVGPSRNLKIPFIFSIWTSSDWQRPSSSKPTTRGLLNWTSSINFHHRIILLNFSASFLDLVFLFRCWLFLRF